MQKLSIGLIGYGYWGERLFKTLQKTDSFRIAAVCDKNPRAIDNLQSQRSESQLTGKYQDIISNKDINAVVIATPAKTHYEITKASLHSGKHVLLEKPMALKKSHARALYKLSSKKKLILMVDHTFLYAPEIRVARKVIERGDLGKVRLIESTRVGPGQYKYDCDVIWDFAPHDISILYYLLGIPKKLTAVNSHHLSRNRIDVSSLYFKFANGCEAHIYLSWLSPIKIRKLLVIGTKRTLLIEQHATTNNISIYSNKCYFRNSIQTDAYGQAVKNIQRLSGLPHEEPLANVCHEFAQSTMGKTQPLSDGYMGYEIVNIIEKLHHGK